MRFTGKLGFIVWFALLALGKVFAADQRPNIVLMVADDHGREAYGAYGNHAIKTPHLDQLAREGTLFNHAYATTASCSASRSVLLSGLHNHANGQYGHAHAFHHFHTFPTVKSLPAYLHEAGYRTARVGKFHLAPASSYDFEFDLKEQRPKNATTVGSRKPMGVKLLPQVVDAKTGERNTVGMALAAKAIIESDDPRPFFLYLATNDPHRSGGVNALGDNIFGNAADLDGKGTDRLDYRPENVIVPHYLPDLPETRRELAEYYQSIGRVDDTAGVLIQQLKAAGKYDNTLFIYLSDNGTAMPGAKTTLYDPGVRLPLVVRAPKQKRRGISVEVMVSWVDITPTILDFAGVEFAENPFHGRSFRKVINGKADSEWNEVYASHTFHEVTMYYPMRMVRTRDYKLIWNIAHGLRYPFASDLQKSSTWQAATNPILEKFGTRAMQDYLYRPKFELYDMSDKQLEPVEEVNLADDPKYAKIKASLIAKLKAFQQRTNDPWKYKWDYE